LLATSIATRRHGVVLDRGGSRAGDDIFGLNLRWALRIGVLDETSADQRFELATRNTQHMPEVDNRQTGAAASGPPFVGHGVRLGAADAKDHRGLLDGQQRRQTRLIVSTCASCSQRRRRVSPLNANAKQLTLRLTTIAR
jgi:hypothetical protein